MFKIKGHDLRSEFHGKYILDNSRSTLLLEYTSEGDYNVYNSETMVLVTGNVQWETIIVGIGRSEDKGYGWKIYDTKQEADEQASKQIN